MPVSLIHLVYSIISTLKLLYILQIHIFTIHKYMSLHTHILPSIRVYRDVSIFFFFFRRTQPDSIELLLRRLCLVLAPDGFRAFRNTPTSRISYFPACVWCVWCHIHMHIHLTPPSAGFVLNARILRIIHTCIISSSRKYLNTDRHKHIWYIYILYYMSYIPIM